MNEPTGSQAILTPLSEAAIFLTTTVNPGEEDGVREALSEVSALRRSVGFRVPEGELTCVVGVGDRVWDRLFGQPRPAELHAFPGFAGTSHRAPATPGDLLFHIRAHRLDLCFELALRLMGRLGSYVLVVDEVHGFKFFDERDMLGFVDGTENPEGDDASAAVIIGDEDPAFAGGSYVVQQKYVHALDAWDALRVEEQEGAIGRTKLSDIELADDVKPANSHVALNTIVDENGEQQQIMRFNMPFGAVGIAEFGTYFIGYARTPAVIERMLTNMFVGNPPGTTDRVLDFSTAVTGTLFFAPTVAFLDDPPAPPLPAAQTKEEMPEPDDVSSDGSLAIGSLRDERR